MKYFALTTRSFEDIAQAEIQEKLSNIEIIDLSYRKVVFNYEGEIGNILQLRSVEDIFLLVDKLENVGHTRDSLEELTERICKLDFTEALGVVSKLRANQVKEFSISSSSVGKRNFTYLEVKDFLSKKLVPKLSLVYDNEKHESFDIRVFLEHSVGLIGVRLSEKPLHRRPYKLSTTKATLRGDIAYSMAYLANIQRNDVVLDPMCGSGTILIEASAFKPKKLIGGDISLEAISATKANVNSFVPEVKIEVEQWDSTKLPLNDSSVDKAICNLPFGKQIDVGDISDFYSKILNEFDRVVKSNGSLILLTSYPGLKNLLKTNYIIKKTYETNLNGEVTTLYVINKTL